MGTPTTILQFGASGQLAREMVKYAGQRPNINLIAIDRRRADFSMPDAVASALRNSGKIDVVVNATAYTAVDKAEQEPELADAVNGYSVGKLAQVCAARGFPLIHVSTDYVFDGRKQSSYIEADTTNPLNAYGRSKLLGENLIRQYLPRHVILRTSWVYSSHGSNFVRSMLRLGAERSELRIVDDQFGAPTSAADIAQCILAIAARMPADESMPHFGTFHYSGDGETTWCRFAAEIFEQSKSWSNARASITAIPSREYPTLAVRPLNSRLNCAKIGNVYGIHLAPWEMALGEVLEQIRRRENPG